MPIKLDDPNALEQLTEKLSKRRQLQEMMKEVNAVIRSSKSDDAKIDFIMKNAARAGKKPGIFFIPPRAGATRDSPRGNLPTTIRRSAASARESGRSNIIGKPPPERKKKAIRNFRSTAAGSWTTLQRCLAELPARVYARLGQTGIQC